MEYTVKNFNESIPKEKFSSYVLGADIGGTNTNLCIAGMQDLKPTLLYSVHVKSNELTSVTPAVHEILRYAEENHNIQVTAACIGVAGVVSSDKQSARLTNAPWEIDLDDLQKHTSLQRITIINDFEAIGFGINVLNPNDPQDLLPVKPRSRQPIHDPQAIIGAGTGLGKSILVYDEHFDVYLPLPSEGGHADFSPQNDQEMDLVTFIKEVRHISHPLPYEELVSGRGLEGIYLFLRSLERYKESMYTNEVDATEDKASLISKYKAVDETCKNAFLLFTRFYARCAKNFVLDTLACGGLYIAGGIALKNMEMFSTKEFIQEFENAYRRGDILKKVPISVITNNHVGLYGTCFAAALFLKHEGMM